MAPFSFCPGTAGIPYSWHSSCNTMERWWIICWCPARLVVLVVLIVLQPEAPAAAAAAGDVEKRGDIVDNAGLSCGGRIRASPTHEPRKD